MVNAIDGILVFFTKNISLKFKSGSKFPRGYTEILRQYFPFSNICCSGYSSFINFINSSLYGIHDIAIWTGQDLTNFSSSTSDRSAPMNGVRSQFVGRHVVVSVVNGNFESEEAAKEFSFVAN